MASYYSDEFDLVSKPATTHLFLAEGQSEVGLIERYLEGLGADASTTTILCFKGMNKIKGRTDTLVKLIEKGPRGLEQLRGVGLLADAEKNPDGRLDVAVQLATSLKFDRPGKDIKDTQRCERAGRRFCVSLSPSHNQQGRIEDLIIKEIDGNALGSCLRTAFGCIEKITEVPVDTKAQVQMFISAKSNSDLSGIGNAFKAKIFDANAAPYGAARTMIDYILSA